MPRDDDDDFVEVSPEAKRRSRIKKRKKLKASSKKGSTKLTEAIKTRVELIRQHATRLPVAPRGFTSSCLVLDTKDGKLEHTRGLSVGEDGKVRLHFFGRKQGATKIMYAYHNWTPAECTHNQIRSMRLALFENNRQLADSEEGEDGFSQSSDKWSWDNLGVKEQKLTWEKLFLEGTWKGLGKAPSVDHLCDVGNCVEPTHLRIASMTENINRRGCLGHVLSTTKRTMTLVCTHDPPCTRLTTVESDPLELDDEEVARAIAFAEAQAQARQDLRCAAEQKSAAAKEDAVQRSIQKKAKKEAKKAKVLKRKFKAISQSRK